MRVYPYLKSTSTLFSGIRLSSNVFVLLMLARVNLKEVCVCRYEGPGKSSGRHSLLTAKLQTEYTTSENIPTYCGRHEVQKSKRFKVSYTSIDDR